MSEEESFVFLETSSLPSALLEPTQKSEIKKISETPKQQNVEKSESKIKKLDGTEIQNSLHINGIQLETEMPNFCEESSVNEMPNLTEASLISNPSMNFLSAQEVELKQLNENPNEIKTENGIDAEDVLPLHPVDDNAELVEKYLSSIIHFTPDATLNLLCEKIQRADIDSHSSNNHDAIVKLLSERNEMLDILKKNAITTRQLINSMQEFGEHYAAFKEKQMKEKVQLKETIAKLNLQITEINKDLSKARKAEQTSFDYSSEISIKVEKIKELEEIISKIKLNNSKLGEENNKIIEENRDLKESHNSIKELFSKACAENVALKTKQKERGLAFEKYEKVHNEMLLEIQQLKEQMKKKKEEQIGVSETQSSQQIKLDSNELSRIEYLHTSTKTATPISEEEDTGTILMCPICGIISDNIESLEVHVNLCLEY